MWNEQFISIIGSDLGHLLEISPAMVGRVDITIAWIKVRVSDQAGLPLMLDVVSPTGHSTIKVASFSFREVSYFAFTGTIRLKVLGHAWKYKSSVIVEDEGSNKQVPRHASFSSAKIRVVSSS